MEMSILFVRTCRCGKCGKKCVKKILISPARGFGECAKAFTMPNREHGGGTYPLLRTCPNNRTILYVNILALFAVMMKYFSQRQRLSFFSFHI